MSSESGTSKKVFSVIINCLLEGHNKLVKKNLGIDITELAYAEGCSECVGGYKGRIAIHEVLVISQEIRDAISNGMPKEELRKLVYKDNTTTLLQDGLQKVLQNKTTIEEILRLVELDDESVKIVSGTDNAPHSNTQPKVEEKPLQQNNDDMEMLDL